MTRLLYTDILAGFLLISAICHILFPNIVGRWLANPGAVRLIGGLLLLLAIPCLWWRGWYFWTLFALLLVSGIWRLCFPRNSIRAQERTYPRWVHGCIMLGGAALVWALRP